MSLPPLILASASPRRAELLREMGLKFRVVPSDASEVHHEQLTARELCQLNAYRKARAVAKKIPDALVLGADTLVYAGTRLFGKPASLAEAGQMIEQLQGRTHQVATGDSRAQPRRPRSVPASARGYPDGSSSASSVRNGLKIQIGYRQT